MLKKWIDEAKHTVVFTGAGMSTESGLPDFRSANKGLWQSKDPSRIASADALNNNVSEFIAFYRERVQGVREYGPHKGHHILAEWEKQGKVQSIITQNVDGFHQQAGSRKVAELHGTLQKLHCQACGKVYDSEDYINQDYHCSCGGILRPSVVLFGETLPEEAFDFAMSEARKSDLFIVMGSSLSVTPANQFPIIAKDSGAKIVIINKEQTEMDHIADQVIQGNEIGEVLAELNSP
ncbi:NAD-dependent protein deacylase [Virgibacillus sediminis]|uniref:NAD-dependent protein deacetylase n=1 Tax=Virgibacillus sediminis TaxID=202260 RepID=A0ABV7A813_9BACI